MCFQQGLSVQSRKQSAPCSLPCLLFCAGVPGAGCKRQRRHSYSCIRAGAHTGVALVLARRPSSQFALTIACTCALPQPALPTHLLFVEPPHWSHATTSPVQALLCQAQQLSTASTTSAPDLQSADEGLPARATEATRAQQPAAAGPGTSLQAAASSATGGEGREGDSEGQTARAGSGTPAARRPIQATSKRNRREHLQASMQVQAPYLAVLLGCSAEC